MNRLGRSSELFPGQYFDQETGLHYNYYRDYDPKMGRYVESDPIGLAAGTNPYTYVNGNPLSYRDPSGKDPLVVIGAIIGGVSGAIQAANSGGGWTSGNAANILAGLGTGAAIGALAGLTPTEWGPLAALITGAAAGGGGNLAGQATSWGANRLQHPDSCTSFSPDWQQAGTQALLGGSAALLGFASGLGYALNAVEGGATSATALEAGAWMNVTTSSAAQVIGNDFIPTSSGGFLP